MLKKTFALLMFIISCSPAYGADTKPTETSIQELMRVTDARKILDNMTVQYDAIMKSSIHQALDGETITPKQQKQLGDLENELISVFKEEMSWDKLESLYVKIYSDSFTQQEVDGMLAFYKSPSGQAVIHKMPLVIQSTLTEMQKRMGPFLQKVAEKEKAALEMIRPGVQ